MEDIEVKETYTFNLGEILKERDQDEVRFVIGAASIANEMQLIIFNIDGLASRHNKSIPDGVFIARLAFFRIYEALSFLERNGRTLKRINSEVWQKYIDIRARFKVENRSLFKWLHVGPITSVRNAFVHCQLEAQEFLQTAEKMKNDMSAIYSFTNKGLNKPELADMGWVRFVFADDFYSNHFVLTMDPTIDLENREREQAVIDEIVKDINEGLGIISALCSMIVRGYMQECFSDFPEHFIVNLPVKSEAASMTPF